MELGSPSYWTRGLHSPLNGIYVPSIEFLKPSTELAYVIGVVLGDRYIDKKKRVVKGYNRIRIGLDVKDKDFADEFARCLGKVLGRSPKKPRIRYQKRYVVEVASKTLYQLLKKPVDLDRLRQYVEHSEECMAAFLRGFFDSEGSVNERGYISISNTDIGLLMYIKDLNVSVLHRRVQSSDTHREDSSLTLVRRKFTRPSRTAIISASAPTATRHSTKRWDSQSRENRNVSKNILEDAKPNPLPLLYLPIQFSIHLYIALSIYI